MNIIIKRYYDYTGIRYTKDIIDKSFFILYTNYFNLKFSLKFKLFGILIINVVLYNFR